jgi:hypothetical protein
MALEDVVASGVRNAFARNPVVDRESIERSLRRANRSVARRVGRIEWIGSLEAYIRRSAELLVEGWTSDDADPLTPPQSASGPDGRDMPRLDRLFTIERELWSAERAAHNTSRLTPSRRLPVYLNAIDAPALASDAARDALGTATLAATVPPPREHGFANVTYWKYFDDHWAQTRALASLPFLVQVADCFAAGLYAAARWRHRDETRTILIERPRLRLANRRLHRANEPAVLWPDGSGRWYWNGIAVPAKLATNRDNLNAEQITRIHNQELRRVALERLGWQGFLETADAELRAQDDYGKLWSTQIRLDGERAQVVEVVNATPEPDGSYRRYFLHVPPGLRTARDAVAWTLASTTPTNSSSPQPRDAHLAGPQTSRARISSHASGRTPYEVGVMLLICV